METEKMLCTEEYEYPEINPRRKEGLIKRVCLTLEYSDPGRLLSLIRSLFENSSDVLQMKINKYLQEVTISDICFIVMTFVKTGEYKITSIGEELLPLDLIMDINSKLVQELSQNKEVVEIPIRSLDKDFNEYLHNYISKMPKYQDIPCAVNNILSVRIKHPVTEKIIMYVLLVNTEKEIDYKRIKAGLVNECMRYCSGIVMNAESFKVEKADHDRARNFIELMRGILINIDDASTMFSQIELGICDLFNAERCNMLLRNECGQLVSKILNYGERLDIAAEPLNNIVVSSEIGLAGIAVETGEVVNCTDAQSDPRYCNNLESKTHLPVKTVLCIPLKSGDEVIGVIEVYNKIDDIFNHKDEEEAEALGVLLPPLIYHSLLDKKLRENLYRRNFVDQLFLNKDKIKNEEVEDVLECEVLHDYTDILSLNYSQYDQSKEHFYCLLYNFFQKFNLIKRFDMKPATLIRFFITIFKNHCDFPFHNWRQSFGTFHFMSVLINELNLVQEGYCTLIEVLALLLASLTHSVYYKGAIHKFEYTCGTALAGLYSSPGTVDKLFQISEIFRLFNRPETNILENIPVDQFEAFTHIYKKLIHITDMGHYIDKMDLIYSALSKYSKDNIYHRVNVLQLLMVSSMLNDYCKDFLHCRKTAESTFSEMIPNVDMTYAEGIFNMKQFTVKNIELVPYLQIQFLKTFCIPTFSILGNMFPVTYQCLERCKDNLAKWESYKDRFEEIIEKENIEKENELQAAEEEHPSKFSDVLSNRSDENKSQPDDDD